MALIRISNFINLINLYQIDCSHGNSCKQHKKQVEVADDIVNIFLAILHLREEADSRRSLGKTIGI